MTAAEFCAAVAQQTQEPLDGTAPAGVATWLLLEVAEPWAERPTEQTTLPKTVRDHLSSQLKEAPETRLQFIRRPGPPSAPLHLYIAHACDSPPILRAIEIGAYEALLELDWQDRRLGTVLPKGHSIVAVCTHGKRDRCCAKWGMPVYASMAEAAQRSAAGAVSDVWQTTHLGGHRFAANVLLLPHGFLLGRVSPQESAFVSEALTRGHLHDLSRLRGRCSLPPAAQAAECHLRKETRETALDAFRHVQTSKTDENLWTVAFEVNQGVRRFRAWEGPNGPMRPPSCFGAPEPFRPWMVESIQ